MKVNIYRQKNVKKNVKEKISVIIPNYNYSQYLIERIDSILLQTIPIYELIILDDASTDDSVQVIQTYLDTIRKEYPSLHVKTLFNQQNSGGCVFAQWQRGLKMATGDYIWIAEADDSSHAKFLETAMKFFQENPLVVLFYSQSKIIDSHNKIIAENCDHLCDIFHTKRWEKDYVNHGVDEVIYYLSSNNTILNVSSVVWKNKKELLDIFEEAKDYRIAGDWYIYAKVLELGDVAFSHEALNYFRKHGHSASTLSIRDKEYKEVYRIQEMIREKYHLSEELVEKQRIRRRYMGYIEEDIKNKKGMVAWFVPALLKGGGGHRTIFQNISALIQEGYQCDVYIGDQNIHTPQELKEMIHEYYGEFHGNVYASWDQPLKDYDCLVATSWNSAPVVQKFECAKKLYFIQDFEPYFFPMGSTYIEAENTYRYGFEGITIGKWLSYKMKNEFALSTHSFPFCADLDVYKKLDDISKEEAICFVFQPDKPRRCDQIALKALQLVKAKKPQVKIYMFGSQPVTMHHLDAVQLGILPIEECNRLYNRCMVGLCMSASNPSRIPFEMMAAGLPVVELYRENNLFDFPNDGVLLALSTPEAICQAICTILDNKEMQEKMSKAGIKYMKDYPLDRGFKDFVTHFNHFFEEKKVKEEKISISYTKEAIQGTPELTSLANSLQDVDFEIKLEKKSLGKRVVRKIKRMLK